MDGFGNAFAQVFNFLIGCFVVAVIGCIYAGYTFVVNIWGDEEIVSPKRITPELQLTIKDNKVDTVFVYKLKK